MGGPSIMAPVERGMFAYAYCSQCKMLLPHDEFQPSALKMWHAKLDSGSRANVMCRVCHTAAMSRLRARRGVGERCSVAGCDGVVAQASRTRTCAFHWCDGARDMCGCRKCRAAVAGWASPKVVARDGALAAEPCVLYLMRISAGADTALIYGQTRRFIQRIAEYRAECRKSRLELELLQTHDYDYLSCVVAEVSLFQQTSRSRWTPGFSGTARENMVDTEASLAVFDAVVADTYATHRTADPEGWEIRRIALAAA